MSSPAELKQEQRYAIRYCVYQGSTVSDTVKEMLVAYGENRLGESTIYRWHAAFSEGRESAALIPHGGRPSTSAAEEESVINAGQCWLP